MLRFPFATQSPAALMAALILSGSLTTARAQADGASVVVAPVPREYASPGSARIAPANAPGGPLMNDLHERMKRIQATPDPAVRQRQHDEFLKTLKDGMEAISRRPPAGR